MKHKFIIIICITISVSYSMHNQQKLVEKPLPFNTFSLKALCLKKLIDCAPVHSNFSGYKVPSELKVCLNAFSDINLHYQQHGFGENCRYHFNALKSPLLSESMCILQLTSEQRSTLFLVAVLDNQVKTVKMLLNKGIFAENKNSTIMPFNQTPLEFTQLRNYKKMEKILQRIYKTDLM